MNISRKLEPVQEYFSIFARAQKISEFDVK